MNNSLKTGADIVVDIIEQRGADYIRKSSSLTLLQADTTCNTFSG